MNLLNEPSILVKLTILSDSVNLFTKVSRILKDG